MKRWVAFALELLVSLALWGAIIAAVLSSAGCAVTPRAALRREGESRFRGCMSGTRCAQQAACTAESVSWCSTQGMERTCGVDGAFPDPIVCP